MNLKKLACSHLAALILVLLTARMAHAVELSKPAGAQLQRKIDDISTNGAGSPVPPKSTTVTESEINSYLAFNIKENIPQGLTEPQIRLLGNGQLAGRVYVDLDEFKRQRGGRGVMDPFNYLSGRVPVTARGVLRTRDGKGQFYLASAEILGVPLPKPVVQELVTFFSRSPQRPRGFDLDAPFNLPASIRELTINPGEAVVVQ